MTQKYTKMPFYRTRVDSIGDLVAAVSIFIAFIFVYSVMYGTWLIVLLGGRIPFGYFSIQDYVAANFFRAINGTFILIVYAVVISIYISSKKHASILKSINEFCSGGMWNFYLVFAWGILCFSIFAGSAFLTATFASNVTVAIALTLAKHISRLTGGGRRWFSFVFSSLTVILLVLTTSFADAYTIAFRSGKDCIVKLVTTNIEDSETLKIVMCGERYTAFFRTSSMTLVVVNNDNISSIEILDQDGIMFLDDTYRETLKHFYKLLNRHGA